MQLYSRPNNDLTYRPVHRVVWRSARVILGKRRSNFSTAGYQLRVMKPTTPNANSRMPNASPMSPTIPMLSPRQIS